MKNLDPYEQLLQSAVKYIESKGGKAVVIGGVEVQQWLGDNKFNYRLAIKFSGRAPKKAARRGGKR